MHGRRLAPSRADADGNVMTDATRCPDPDALLVLLYDDEGEPGERAALESHLVACPSCTDALKSLDATRGVLGAWHAPRLPLGFAVVRTPAPSLTGRLLRGSGLAAAAVLVLAAASSLAQLQITYDATGLHITTGGASNAAVQTVAATPATPAALGAPGSAPVTAASASASPASWVDAAGKSDAPWRADLELVASQLRAELERAASEAREGRTALAMRVAVPPAPQPASRSMSDTELLKRVQDLLDQSEVRQQQNLALRVTELGRQFELARQADIVQVEQTLTRIERQRNELLRRVAATQPRP